MPHAVTIAHLIRPLLAAGELKKRGHEVFFGLTNLKFSHLLDKEGIPFKQISGIDSEKAIEIVRNYRYNIKEVVSQLNQDLGSDLKLIEEFNPHLVVNDMRFTVKMACRLKKIPYAIILNAYYTGKLASMHSFPEKIPLSKITPRFIQRRCFGLTWKAMDYLLGTAMRILARKRGIPGINNVTQSIISPSLNLISDLPEFFPCRNLTKNFIYAGPFLWEPDMPLPDWFLRLDESKPVIYFTLGTSGTTGHLAQIIRRIIRRGFQAVVTTGGARFEEELGEGAFIADFLPALKILDKVSLVICHGGNGSIYQALSKGIPVIGLPTFYDQEWNTERLQDLRLGRKASPADSTGAKVIEAVEELIVSREVKENCRRFKELIAGYDAPRTCAGLLEGL